MMFQEPKLLHSMLSILADNIADYANFQIEAGAQVIQVFDSWAGHLSPKDYDEFAAPYQVRQMPMLRPAASPQQSLTGGSVCGRWRVQRQVVSQIKAKNPQVPIIIYINKVRRQPSAPPPSSSSCRASTRSSFCPWCRAVPSWSAWRRSVWTWCLWTGP